MQALVMHAVPLRIAESLSESDATIRVCNDLVAVVAGLHYCQGLYERYCSNHKAALKAFNLARKDSHW